MTQSCSGSRLSRLFAAAVCLAGIGLAREAGAVDWRHAQPVTAIATEYAFTPSSFTFKAGVAYRLHVENRGKELHEFASREFFRAIRVRNPKALTADRSEIDVQPGQAKDLFFVAKTPGSFKLICPDHDWAGMVGDITIVP